MDNFEALTLLLDRFLLWGRVFYPGNPPDLGQFAVRVFRKSQGDRAVREAREAIELLQGRSATDDADSLDLDELLMEMDVQYRANLPDHDALPLPRLLDRVGQLLAEEGEDRLFASRAHQDRLVR